MLYVYRAAWELALRELAWLDYPGLTPDPDEWRARHTGRTAAQLRRVCRFCRLRVGTLD